MGKHSVRAQLKAYRRQVAALSVQKVWRGRCHRKQHGVFEFQPQPSERAHGRSAGAKPFWVKGADVDSELDMYHGPVELPEGHHALSARSSASPNRSEPLPRRGHRRGRGPAGAPMVRKMRPLGSGGGGVGGEDAASTTLPLLNHALDNGATRIQAVARGRRARKAYILTVAGAVKMQSIIRRLVLLVADLGCPASFAICTRSRIPLRGRSAVAHACMLVLQIFGEASCSGRNSAAKSWLSNWHICCAKSVLARLACK